jgi:hypothetical protein
MFYFASMKNDLSQMFDKFIDFANIMDKNDTRHLYKHNIEWIDIFSFIEINENFGFRSIELYKRSYFL